MYKILVLLFLLPLTSHAVELPRTEEEFIQRAISAQISEFAPNINEEVFMAIGKAESQLNPLAIGYNCLYGGVSMTCKVKDRNEAKSVDCGIFQLNFKGKVCPFWTFDIHANIAGAIMIHKQQGLKAWVVYSRGTYKRYL